MATQRHKTILLISLIIGLMIGLDYSPLTTTPSFTVEALKLNNQNLIDLCPEADIASLVPPSDLDETCSLLKFFNQTEVDEIGFENTARVALHCACQLIRLPWAQAYDDHDNFQRLEHMVDRVLKKKHYELEYPPYLWSDLDLIMNGVSVFHSMRDYFAKVRRHPSLALMSREEQDRDEAFHITRYVCHRIGADRMKLYQYLENLERLSPLIAMQTIESNQYIYTIFQASKACKLLIVHHLAAFRLYPPNRQMISSGPVRTFKEESDMGLNTIDVGAGYSIEKAGGGESDDEAEDQEDKKSNFTLALRKPSMHLMNCQAWNSKHQHEKKAELVRDCPMITGNRLPVEWVKRNPSSLERSRAAIRCGCQLLMNNATWRTLIRDKEVNTLNRAITQYIDSNKFPNFHQAPLWSIYGWFNSLVDRFVRDKQKTVDAVIQYEIGLNSTNITQLGGSNSNSSSIITNRHGQFVDINKVTADSIETVRVACLKLLFNYQLDEDKKDELKVIQYLDNLKYVAKDPMFVFHLTLHDANLFKLHALAKICEPFTK